MQIGGGPRGGTEARQVRPVEAARAAAPPDRGRAAPQTPAPAGRAAAPGLPVLVVRPEAGRFFAPFGASAPLLAQLIACRLCLPQTRRLRRGSCREAGRAYGEAERLSAPATPRPRGIRL